MIEATSVGVVQIGYEVESSICIYFVSFGSFFILYNVNEEKIFI